VYKINHFCLALDYIEGVDDRIVSIGELALIYAILPELMLDMMAGNDIDLEAE
jgi:hypothetical protein